jgi:hypothetical protein
MTCSCPRRLTVIVSVAAVLWAGCIRFGQREERQVVVPPAPLIEMQRTAAAYVSSDAVSRLRKGAQRQFPAWSGQELRGMSLQWRTMARGSSEYVVVVLILQDPKGDGTASAVADYCGQTIYRELSTGRWRDGGS